MKSLFQKLSEKIKKITRHKEVQEKSVGIVGIYEFTLCECKTQESMDMARDIEERRKDGRPYKKRKKEFQKKYGKVTVIKNKVPDVALEIFAKRMSSAFGAVGDANDPRVSYASLGTGTAAAAAGDTTLETEVFRDTINSQSFNSNIAYNEITLGLSDGNGNTFSEAGLFAGDASATVDTGVLMSRVILSPTFVKDNTKTLTIKVQHGFSDI